MGFPRPGIKAGGAVGILEDVCMKTSHETLPSHPLWKYILGLSNNVDTTQKEKGGEEIRFGTTSLAGLGNLKKDKAIKR